jgi:hypothetical protein
MYDAGADACVNKSIKRRFGSSLGF